MNTRKPELIKESFDRWDRDHPLWHFNDFPSFAQAKETCPFLSEELPDKEKNILIYIWCSLTEGQEYDAGNAILLTTQTGLLSNVAIEKIADYLALENERFESKIGKIVFIAIFRSIGLWSFISGQKDVGLKLWKSGIEIVRTMKYRRDEEIKKWREMPEMYSVPIELQMLLRELD